MSTTQSAAIGIIGGADGPTAIFVASNSLVPQLLSVAAALAIGYLLGSLMFGIIVSKGLFHDDVRSHGSGNAGSTNILRTYGKGAAALALAGDMGKGVLAVFLARWAACLIFGLPLDCAGAAFGPEGFNVGAAAAFAALLGHMKPLYFGFKGGKGIATSFGSLLFVFPVQALLAFSVFLILVAVTRYVSVGSVAAAITLPALVFLTCPENMLVCVITACIGLSVIWRHRANIKRLLSHTESKLDFNTLKKKKKH